MTLSNPLLAAAPLIAGLMGPTILGAVPGQQQVDRPAAVQHSAAREALVVEHEAARGDAEQRRVLGYWTPQRMAAALPIGLLDTVTDGRGLLDPVTGDLLSGMTRHGGVQARPDVSGGHTEINLGRRHQASSRPQASTIGSRWSTGGAVTRTTGRVFLTLAGADFVCSASTVSSASKDLVVTAGHCVKDGQGEWAENWTFVPGYGRGGEQPYGQYAARRMFVAAPWSRSADDNHDVGMVALTTSGGRHVADVVGTQDIAFNARRGGQTYGFGYPADPPYDGDRLVYCAGRLRDDPYKQTHDQGLGCAMTAGSSGGPWMSDFDPMTGRGTITSLSSFKYSDDQHTMYGPYFGEAAKAVYATAERA
ncbi:trypsin-like serine peptidase [Nonomuraea spiralis]|uniref:Trypsin-like serine peptidase n=1 Tax=Nonomuraea spiralis TaxID=46182 RepID=A0ABV5IKT9_9ACTN|nr:trypsin-like serine protease [Nonomuraea spiralis]GGT36436.1 peptidase [Nonomuraea spiralis]